MYSANDKIERKCSVKCVQYLYMYRVLRTVHVDIARAGISSNYGYVPRVLSYV